ncbi:MAG: hypothetical protein A3K19_14470 [Lentisphaerae bacterium RIFOXYB12_FULL_65_16]|nr:MAG: hypothetical protein A3K18_18515 [Lentisphaerae bacterium RIFOXYA12_64_32]OGV87428.1 MAG: hypothetical protein A3K19_14470 [Lentisphaerae bacterium RIFOXYB12_FULL_65_16]
MHDAKQTSKRVLLVTPPLIQCNAPYPATPMLAAWLRQQGVEVAQYDASLALLLRLFSTSGLQRVGAVLRQRRDKHESAFFRDQFQAYVEWVEPVVRFLQGKDPSLAYRLARSGVLPEGPRFHVMRDQEMDEDGTLQRVFGKLGVADQARYLASLFLDDITGVVTRCVDPDFGLSRYAERLCQSLPSFDPLLQRLDGPPTLIDEMIDETAEALWHQHHPDVVAFTVPFPGTLYGALRLARGLKRLAPTVRVALGGGYVNTELRELREARLFDSVNYVCIDDGFAPLRGVVRHARGEGTDVLVRTFIRDKGQVRLADSPTGPEPGHGELPAPAYADLPLGDYLGLAEMLNPMHVLWSSQRWNKLMAAHGCYWHRCAFCDTSLDHIHRFQPATATRVVDWMEDLIRQTGSHGFHFVDEALPPALVRRLAREILRRGLVVAWWGNVRFENAFDADLAALMAQSGCIAVTGGLEAFDDRLLTLLTKGISVAGAVRACAVLADAGILVHAYLMYGVPTETTQETVDSLERLRQMFALGLVHSAYWHRFALTAHSGAAANPQRYGIVVPPTSAPTFTHNEIAFADSADENRDDLGRGLHRAVYNYMHGVGLAEDVRAWFDVTVPRPRVGRRAIERSLRDEPARQ